MPDSTPTVEGLTTIDALRSYVDFRLHEMDQRYQQRYDYSQRALDTAETANSARLEKMNEFRAALADQATQLATRHEMLATSDALRLRVEAEMSPIKERVESMGRTNWPLFAAGITVCFGLISGIWVIIGLKIDATNQPVSVAVETAKADRVQLDGRMRSLESAIATGSADRRSTDASHSAALIEIETQFRSASLVMNLQQDHTQQMLGLLYAVVFKAPLPPSSFRPQLNK